MDELPWVLLGLRTAPKDDLHASTAELVYGAHSYFRESSFCQAARTPLPRQRRYSIFGEPCLVCNIYQLHDMACDSHMFHALYDRLSTCTFAETLHAHLSRLLTAGPTRC